MSDVLTIRGITYPATASEEHILNAEHLAGEEPLLLIKAQAGQVVVTVKHLQEANPMLCNIVRAHLDGKWLMIMGEEPLTTQLRGSTIERIANILDALPLKWGDQPGLCKKLNISPRQLQETLKAMRKMNLVESPGQGQWVAVSDGDGYW